MLYDQGSSAFREDGLVNAEPFFGVLDGVSAPYNKWNPAYKYGTLTGGELTARLVEETFVVSPNHRNLILPNGDGEANVSVMEALMVASAHLGKIHRQHGFDLGKANTLPGATFAIAKVDNDVIEVVQGGDCFAIWVDKSGRFGNTKNQVRLHDHEMNDTIVRLQLEIAAERGVDFISAGEVVQGEITDEMWRRFFDILNEARRQDVNNPESHRGYSLINGQLGVKNSWSVHMLPRNEIALVLLISDGMAPWGMMKDSTDELVSQAVLEAYKKGGLVEILRAARHVEDETKIKYTKHQEATALAIEFEN